MLQIVLIQKLKKPNISKINKRWKKLNSNSADERNASQQKPHQGTKAGTKIINN